MLSLATLLVSLSAMLLSTIGAGRLFRDIFEEGLAGSLAGLPVKGAVLAFSYLFGWTLGLVCIRGFGNLVYPIILRVYSWACLAGVSFVYIRVIQKLFVQAYDGLHFWAYLVILLSGLLALIGLNLLVEGQDLRPHAIPLMIISVLHLFLIVQRYVFTANPNGRMLFGDLTIFMLMISTSALMLAHLGILSPLREEIGRLFDPARAG